MVMRCRGTIEGTRLTFIIAANHLGDDERDTLIHFTMLKKKLFTATQAVMYLHVVMIMNYVDMPKGNGIEQ